MAGAEDTRRGDEFFVLNGTKYDFMFGAGPLAVSSVAPFSPKTVTGDRSYADYEPASAVAFADFSGGMGQERVVDPTKYYKSENCDARSGHLTLGPLAHSSSSPNLPAWVTAPVHTQWYSVDNTRTKLAVHFQPSENNSNVKRIWLPIKAKNTGSGVTVSIYNGTSSAPTTVNGSLTTTFAASVLSEEGSWYNIELGVDTPALLSASHYWIVVEHSGTTDAVQWFGDPGDNTVTGNTVYWNGSAWVNTNMTHVRMLYWFEPHNLRPDVTLKLLTGSGGDLVKRVWGYGGSYVYYANSSSVMTAVGDGAGGTKKFTVAPVDATFYREAVAINSHMWLCFGDSADIVKFNANLSAITWTTSTGYKGYKLAVHDKWLFVAQTPSKVSGTDGTSWATGTTIVDVGDAAYPIRNMASWNGDLWVIKDDGLYRLVIPDAYPAAASAVVVEKVIDLTSQAGSENGRLFVVYQNDLIFSVGHGLMRYTSGNVLTVITPDIGIDEQRLMTYVSAAPSVTELWVLAKGPVGGSSELLSYADGHWQPQAKFTNVPVRSVVLEPGYYGSFPRLWVGGFQYTYFNMPTDTKRRWLVSGIDYAETGTHYYSWIDGNLPTMLKDWMSVDVVAFDSGPIAANAPYTEVFYSSDEGALTSLGYVVTNGRTAINFPASTYGTKLQIVLGLHEGSITESVNGVTTAVSHSPRIEAVVVNYMERPDDSLSFTRSYKLGNRLVWRNGVQTQYSIAQQMADLSLLRTSAEPLTWYPWFGGSYKVHIVNYQGSESRDSIHPVQDVGSITMVVKLQVVEES